MRKLDGVQDAKLLAVACGKPPTGQARWSLRLLANKLVELEIGRGRRLVPDGAADSEKTALKPHLRRQWCIAPQATGDFVWRREDVLEVYTRPYDPRRALVYMDETSKRCCARQWAGHRLCYGLGQHGYFLPVSP